MKLAKSLSARDPATAGCRILLLSPTFPPTTGGVERTAAQLAAGLAEHQLEVVAGLPQAGAGMLPPPGLRVHWAANDPPGGRRATISLLRQAIRAGLSLRPDLVLALHIRTMPAARALSQALGSRTVLVVHASEMREQPNLARAAVCWADSIVSVSGFSRELALEAGARPQQIRLIHPGVTPSPVPPPLLEARSGPRTVITVARMSEPYKGHDVALAALERLHARLPDVRWVMVGDGPLRESLAESARRRGLDGSVTFTGPIDDAELHRRLNAAHAFCLLSRQPPAAAAGEGFGIAFAEAGAHRLPVVAGRVPGVSEAVRDGVSGLLVDPTDPQQAAAALERLLIDRGLAQQLADAGFSRATELGWPVVVERYRGAIALALAKKQARRNRDFGWLRDLARGPGPAKGS